MTQRIRTSVRVEGVVQGVGFRPFVYSLAARLGLAGWVGNDVDGVFAEVEGPAESVRKFLDLVEREAPPLARVERVTAQAMTPNGATGFAIAPSDPAGRRRALVSADSATCADCLAELADPGDRRFGYPFINCTNCGPRFTIVRDVPYDRPLTTMAGFTMCADCAAEYHDPANRRFHAQPVCCPACGPRLRLLDAAGTEVTGIEVTGTEVTGTEVTGTEVTGTEATGGALAGAVRVLRQGQVLAVKGLGGYHLAVDAGSQDAAALLRARKHREDKPFAVMVADVAAAGELCQVDEVAAGLLTSTRRPVVLLPRRPGAPVADAIAPGNRQLGIMLPYTPLHHLLLHDFGGPIVLTSGNISDEPIAYQDADALHRLDGIADAFLTHDRPIHMRADDSVVRSLRGREMMLRRSRGYAPEPLTLRGRFRRPVLACGAELKSTFCLGTENRAILSQHIGDLENYETLRSFTEGIEHFRRLFDITPEVVAYDLHPEYLSTKYALELDDVELVERAGHLAGVPMPGGAAAIRQPWRMAAAYLDAAYPEGLPGALAVAARNPRAWPDVLAMARRGINAPVTSSAGRLFDAVAALLGPGPRPRSAKAARCWWPGRTWSAPPPTTCSPGSRRRSSPPGCTTAWRP